MEMPSEEILKAVFPFLGGKELATSMLVCKQWQDIAQDDYFWKCLCAKRWPSLIKRPSPHSLTYHQLYKSFIKRNQTKIPPPPKLSFNDLEFYIDIWAEGKLLFSEIVPGPVIRERTWVPPNEVSDVLKYHLDSPDYKMTFPVQPRFNIPFFQTVSVSVLVGRKDSGKIGCIISKSVFDYIDRTAYRAMAFESLEFSPEHPFLPDIRAWISLLFMDHSDEGVIDVFAIELDFCDAATSEDRVLWLLDMLDWM